MESELDRLRRESEQLIDEFGGLVEELEAAPTFAEAHAIHERMVIKFRELEGVTGHYLDAIGRARVDHSISDRSYLEEHEILRREHAELVEYLVRAQERITNPDQWTGSSEE